MRATLKKRDIVEPTPEQMRTGAFAEVDTYEEAGNGRMRKIGKAMRRTPMIEMLHRQGLFSDDEFKALRHYRHHADIADRSPIMDSLGKRVGGSGGGGDGPTVEVLNALAVVRDCEAAAGALRDILRAVVVDDMSLSQWAIRQYGGIDDCTPDGVCRLKPRQKALAIAKLDIQMVAKRVEAELSA